jgi:hypothetical protein
VNDTFEVESETEISRDFVLESLEPTIAKCWIRTRALLGSQGPLTWWTATPKLRIQRWANTEGRFAPYPAAEDAWLDIKGAFVGSTVYQRKSPEKRAHILHNTGWA